VVAAASVKQKVDEAAMMLDASALVQGAAKGRHATYGKAAKQRGPPLRGA
jgi:hypothetical protein